MLNPKRNTIIFQDDKIYVLKKGSYHEVQNKTGFILSCFETNGISTKVGLHISANLSKWRDKC